MPKKKLKKIGRDSERAFRTGLEMLGFRTSNADIEREERELAKSERESAVRAISGLSGGVFNAEGFLGNNLPQNNSSATPDSPGRRGFVGTNIGGTF